MFSWHRIRLGIGLAWLVALSLQVSIADAQPPGTPNPPKAKRPGSPQSRPAPARPQTNGPQVQLVSPAEDADLPLRNEIRIATPPDDPFPPQNPQAQAPRPAGDPTIPSPEVRQMLEAGNANRTNNQPAQVAASLPAMSIKARLISHNKPPVAVIDVGGTTLTIHMGDTFSIGAGGPSGNGIRLKVVEMNQKDIRFEVENRRQILTLN